MMDKGYSLEQVMMAYSVYSSQNNDMSDQTLIDKMTEYIQNMQQSMLYGNVW